MYEMYPQTWTVVDPPAEATRPRRRPRKAHSVLPAVIARQLEDGTPVRPAA